MFVPIRAASQRVKFYLRESSMGTGLQGVLQKIHGDATVIVPAFNTLDCLYLWYQKLLCWDVGPSLWHMAATL